MVKSMRPKLKRFRCPCCAGEYWAERKLQNAKAKKAKAKK